MRSEPQPPQTVIIGNSKVFFWLLLFFSSFSLYAPAQQKYYRFYTSDDGLPSSTVATWFYQKPILQDKNGFIWMGTFGGVSIYDGNKFTNYSVENGGLSNDIVVSFFEKDSNEVWTIEPRSVDIFVNRKKIKSFQSVGFPTSNFLHTKDQRVLIATKGDVYEIKNYTPQQIASFPHSITVMYEVGDYFLVQDHPADSIFLVDHSFQKISGRLKGNIFTDRFHRYWYFNSKFYQLDTLALHNGSFKLMSSPTAISNIKLAGQRLWDFLADIDGFFWIALAGEKGLIRVDPEGNIMRFDMRALKLMEDADRNIWMSHPAGFVKFYNKYNDFYGKAEGLSHEGVTCIAEDQRNGAAWIAQGQGLSCIYKNEVFNLTFPVNQRPPLLIRGDSLWIGDNDLFVYKISYDGKPRMQLLKKWKIPSKSDLIWSMQPDINGSMIFSKSGNGIYRATWNGKLQLLLRILHSPVLIDGDELWTGDFHDKPGNVRSDLFRWKIIREKDSIGLELLRAYENFTDGRLETFTKDAAGNIWIGTINKGVIKLEKQKNDSFIVRNYYSKDQLSNPWVSRILINKKGEIFVATFGGDIYQLHELKDSFYFEDLTDRCGGIKSTWDFIQDAKGNFWISTPVGAVHVGNDLYKKPPAPKVIITGFLKNNQADSSIFTNGANKFRYNENNLVLEFSATSFRDESKVQYSYQIIKGNDSAQWSVPQKIHAVSLLSLAPGSYTIKIKAVTAEKVWSEKPAQYSFIIAPPFWNTWWFRILLVFSIFSIIFSLYQYRVSQLKKLVKVRTKISRDLHDEVGSTLSGIGLLSEVAMQQLDKEKNNEVRSSLLKINSNSDEILEKMSDIVWTINPKNDNFGKVIIRLKSYAKTMTDSLGVQLHFYSDNEMEQFNLEMQKRNNVYLICKEAINNAVKYSECRNLNFSLVQKDHQINISIVDDGKGFDTSGYFDGNGLKNMRSRAKEINADLKMDSEPGRGTSINLYLKFT